MFTEKVSVATTLPPPMRLVIVDGALDHCAISFRTPPSVSRYTNERYLRYKGRKRLGGMEHPVAL